MPIFFHNLQNYDLHLFKRKLLKLQNVKFGCIPRTNYKYISFSVYFPYKLKEKIKYFEIRFLDSLQFLPSSLDKLSEYYNNNFKITKSLIPENGFDLLCKKGVFPYNYIKTHKRLNEDKLPPIEEFYDTLKLSKCTDEEYQRAQQIWKLMNCKTIKDYLAIYLKTDVLILADIIEDFRSKSLEYYGLDPVYYYTSPNYFWDACLKFSKVKLELLTEEQSDIYLMEELAKRGGISQTGSRKLVVNPDYKGKVSIKNMFPNTKVEEGFIEYYDVNSLYAWAMTKKLPVGDFRFIDVDEFIAEEKIIRNKLEKKEMFLKCKDHVNFNEECDSM